MFLVELAVILLAAKVAGDLASRWGQPPVLGQLVAGLALGWLGGSLLPNPFLADSQEQIDQLANLGVLFLMFLAGLETDWQQLRATGRPAFVSACLGVLVPLLAGWQAGLAFHLAPTEALFLGIILTATSVSITAQTLLELGSLRTIEGATILGAAVIDDVIGLLVFSIAVAGLGAGQGGTPIFLLIPTLVAFFVLAPTLGARVSHWILDRAQLMQSSEAPLAVAIAIMLLFSLTATQAGIAGITGAYLAGLIINRRDLYGDLTEKVRVLAYGLFVPVFLVKTGMDARVEAMGPILGLVLAVSCIAILTKVVGCGLGARVSGLTSRQSLVVGVGMVSRGEVALIVASLSLQANVISQVLFSATVVIVLVTTLVTPALLRLALQKAPELGPVGQEAALIRSTSVAKGPPVSQISLGSPAGDVGRQPGL